MSIQIYGIVIVKQTTSHFCVDVAFQKLFRLDPDKVIGLIRDVICRNSPLYTVGCCATLVGFRLECTMEPVLLATCIRQPSPYCGHFLWS